MSREDGGPAFPSTEPDQEHTRFYAHHDGMTLRDYFAAKEKSWPPITWWQARVGSHVSDILDLHGVELSEGLAAWRFQCADAMLKARAK